MRSRGPRRSPRSRRGPRTPQTPTRPPNSRSSDTGRVAATLARRLRERVRAPIASGAQTLTVGASVGIAFVEAARSPETVLRKADAAMYWAKQTDQGIAAYEHWMHEEALRRLGAVSPPSPAPRARQAAPAAAQTGT